MRFLRQYLNPLYVPLFASQENPEGRKDFSATFSPSQSPMTDTTDTIRKAKERDSSPEVAVLRPERRFL